jgi:F-type H+-transporting ATPase subunit b
MTRAWGPLRALRRPANLFALAFFLLATAAPAFAQEEGSPADTTIGWVFRWLNFVLVFGGIAYLLAKVGRPLFHNRAEAVANAIAEATRLREEAEARLREAEAKLAGLEREIAALRAEARREGAAEADRIRALARYEAEKIARAAQLEIQVAERAVRMELKAAGARLAIDRAESLLRGEITPQAESALFRGFVRDLERSAN